jgi:hypothetical protein
MDYGITSINLPLWRSVKGNVFQQCLQRTGNEANQCAEGAVPDVRPTSYDLQRNWTSFDGKSVQKQMQTMKICCIQWTMVSLHKRPIITVCNTNVCKLLKRRGYFSLYVWNIFQGLSSDSVAKYLYHYSSVRNRLCGLMVRVPSYKTQMYCVSWEVSTEFIYVM